MWLARYSRFFLFCERFKNCELIFVRTLSTIMLMVLNAYYSKNLAHEICKSFKNQVEF